MVQKDDAQRNTRHVRLWVLDCSSASGESHEELQEGCGCSKNALRLQEKQDIAGEAYRQGQLSSPDKLFLSLMSAARGWCYGDSDQQATAYCMGAMADKIGRTHPTSAFRNSE